VLSETEEELDFDAPVSDELEELEGALHATSKNTSTITQNDLKRPMDFAE